MDLVLQVTTHLQKQMRQLMHPSAVFPQKYNGRPVNDAIIRSMISFVLAYFAVILLIAALLGFDLQQQAWIGLAAIIGHLYPVYFRFRGGKGVATAAGMLLGLYPPAALLAICAWLLTFVMTRTSSLAALIATPLTLPLLAWQQPAALVPVSVLTGLIVWRHRSNLRDLFAGRERHF